MRHLIFIIPLLFITYMARANSAADMMLIRAIQDDNFREAKYWLEHGANANCTSNEGSPVLSMAMQVDFNRHHSLDKFDNSVPLTELLLQKGADPNSNVSLLPLISAVLKLGDYRLCNVLLKYGANPRMIEPYEEVDMNAISYARYLGYTRVANLLANPKSYSDEYTVFELNYLIKISFDNEKYDEAIKYCNQFYTQLPKELSSNYNGWLTKAHIYFYHESALLQKSLIASSNNNHEEAEQLLREAIKYENERKQAGDTAELGVDLNQALVQSRSWRPDNPAAVLDILEFQLQQGKKDTTTISLLIEAATYYSQLTDLENRYECIKMAYTWIQEDANLRNSLSDVLYWRVISEATHCYSSGKGAIVSELDLVRDLREMRRRFSATSKELLSYELAVAAAYTFYFNKYSVAEKILKDVIGNTEDKSLILNVLAKFNLASIYEHGMKDSEKAYTTLKEIVTDAKFQPFIHDAIYEEWIGLCYKLEKFDEIWLVVKNYYRLRREGVDNAMIALSEEDLLAWYGRSRPFFYDGWIVFATKYAKNTPSEVIEELYDNELYKKGLLLRSIERMKLSVSQSSDPTILYLYERLQQQKRDLLNLESSSEKDYSLIKELANKINSTERLLVAQSKDFKAYNEINIDWRLVKHSLKQGEVAIEFMNYGSDDQYFALVLRSEWESPKLIVLPDMKIYSEEYKDFQMRMYKEYAEEVGLYDLKPQFLQVDGDAGEVYKYGGNGTKLYEALWEPLTQCITKGDVVYFAPSGVLLQLAIEALPVNDKSVLADHYRLIRLSSTRELALSHTKNPEREAVLYGNIQYDTKDLKLMQTESERYKNISRGMSVRANDGIDRGSWQPIPGSKVEINTISTLLSKARFKSSILDTYHANEESFKSLSGHSPQVLHIATHGFYWDNDRATTEPFIAHTTIQGTTMVDPLSRCGLVFASANLAYSGHGSLIPPGIEDGILTAKEISLLDLSNTKLLVLSACETGLGELTDAGVFGLQRAFKQAGVETIVMSLWKVDDEYTQKMMSKFYELWLSGQDKRTAFYNAQKYIRSLKPDPYYWAGFIMLD